MTVPLVPPHDWLDKYIEQQAKYWTDRGLPANIVNDAADAIELYGDDYLEQFLLPKKEPDNG